MSLTIQNYFKLYRVYQINFNNILLTTQKLICNRGDVTRRFLNSIRKISSSAKTM